MAESYADIQMRICQAYGAEFSALSDDARLGVAMHTVELVPLYGVRLKPVGNMCGWWIHGGEWSDAVDFYSPLCYRHVPETCEYVMPFLGLPVGWRFLTDGSGEFDVWLEPDSD